MQFIPCNPPRQFPVGVREVIHLKDCGRVVLEPDEQVTFVTDSGAEYDVVRKSWGYYATPSLNHRLLSFGLKAALVRSGDRLYLLLVEEAKEVEFQAYLQRQGMKIVAWLDRSDSQTEKASCLFCGSTAHTLVFVYDAPPSGETLFPLHSNEQYHREIWQCQGCSHFVNRHRLDLRRLYEGGYGDATYSGDKLLTTFRTIMALSPERSDNQQRVQRIVAYMREKDRRENRDSATAPTLLDVGSGLCVFPARMKDEGWQCTALDPDPRAVTHARQQVGVSAICGDFFTAAALGAYDLITFNKVLEHVEDPVLMLRKSRQHLRPGGVVYVEAPDGEEAMRAGSGREEFFIEHFHIFSFTSVSLLAAHAEFSVRRVERVREPSGKYTLRAFLQISPMIE